MPKEAAPRPPALLAWQTPARLGTGASGLTLPATVTAESPATQARACSAQRNVVVQRKLVQGTVAWPCRWVVPEDVLGEQTHAQSKQGGLGNASGHHKYYGWLRQVKRELARLCQQEVPGAVQVKESQ